MKKITFRSAIFLFSFCSILNLLGAIEWNGQNYSNFGRQIAWDDEDHPRYYQRSTRERDFEDQRSLYLRRITELNTKLEQYLARNQMLQNQVDALKAIQEVQEYQRKLEDLHVPKTLPENYLAHAKPEQLRSIIAALQLELAFTRQIIAKNPNQFCTVAAPTEKDSSSSLNPPQTASPLSFASRTQPPGFAKRIIAQSFEWWTKKPRVPQVWPEDGA